MAKTPLWKLLVDRGLFEDRKTATSWIMAGKVIVHGRRMDKAGHLVPEHADLRIKGLSMKYVGKGGLKLEGALSDFDMDVSDKVVLDVGAAAGGFTDCLLQHGVTKVYAIDAGYGQLAGKLRADPRVVNMERTNISDVSPDLLRPEPSLATVDLSYLSLKEAIPILSRLLEPKGEMLCLVKPLFEVPDSQARRTGMIADPTLLREVLHDLVKYVDSIGLKSIGVTHSHVRGNKGTEEFFLRISSDASAPRGDICAEIAAAVEAALKLPRYRGGTQRRIYYAR